ncbi:hypothetical protein C2G38_2185219 [Gigaspora rosea]|uniref:Uncharacterized protein n=1 Tax=Gigaspora rosea TaxID=44941 RepID=A0A397V709_9GLOM|nr:hypothetical protein C2G38_2185219 [Gigaspora rosea]
MEEFVLKASFDDEETNSNHSQEFCISIAAEHHEEAFITEDKINEFSESDDIIKEEFEKLVATETKIQELSSTWEVDLQAVKNARKNLSVLHICTSAPRFGLGLVWDRTRLRLKILLISDFNQTQTQL